MPATDSSSSPAAAPLASIGRSIGRSLRRDHHHNNQIHSIPHPHAHPHPPSDLDAADAFQRRAADLLTHLGGGEDADLLSLAWTTRLLDAFLLCLEDFRALLFGPGAHLAARAPLDRLVADFFDRAVKALDLCNAVRDGLDLVRQCRSHLAIAAAALSAAPLGEAQIRRARKALTDLTILMLQDTGGRGVVGQRNRSFDRAAAAKDGPRPQGQGQGHGEHHRRSSRRKSRRVQLLRGPTGVREAASRDLTQVSGAFGDGACGWRQATTDGANDESVGGADDGGGADDWGAVGDGIGEGEGGA